MKYAVPVIKSGSLLLAMCMFSGPLAAEAMKFIPRASVGIASYDFVQSARPGALGDTGINNGDFPEVKFNVTFKILGVGGTFIKDGYYFDASFQDSFDEEDTFTFEEAAFTETFKGDRQDYAFTFGKKILNNRAGVYLGYKVGKSQADGDQGEKLSFEEDGFFIGGNYGWPIAGKGVLSVNLAYADLDGDLKEDVTNPGLTSLPVPPLSMDASSDAQGLSYGVSWSSRFTQKLSYSVALDGREYTFDNVKDKNPDVIPSDEFKEEFLGATFSLFYLF